MICREKRSAAQGYRSHRYDGRAHPFVPETVMRKGPDGGERENAKIRKREAEKTGRQSSTARAGGPRLPLRYSFAFSSFRVFAFSSVPSAPQGMKTKRGGMTPLRSEY